jgi:hypothetical protein
MPLGARLLAALPAAAALTGCLATTVPPPAAVAPAAGPIQTSAPASPPPAWPDAAGGCRALAKAVLAMPEAERRRLSADASPFALAAADSAGALLPAEDAADTVDADLPLRAIGRADDAAAAPCLLVLGRPRLVPGGGRRLVGHEVVRSEYRTGSRRTVNPEYRRLRDAAEAEEDGGRGPGGSVLATGDPMLDLIGLAGGLVLRGVNRLRPAREDPAAALARTERYLESATFEPYTYKLTSFEVGRAGVLDAALVDRAAGRILEARHTLRERRTFPVAEGRHRSDRGLLEGTGPQALLPEDVALFEGEPPRPPLSDVLRLLLAAGNGEDRPGGVADALAALSAAAPPPAAAQSPEAPLPAAADASSPTVPDSSARVTVYAGEGPVEGTWTGPERIEVPTASLGRSRLVEVEGPDGMRTLALVERVDHAAGRAVIRVSRPATARRVSDEGLESVLRDLKRR